MPKISIIIAVYNGMPYLTKCLDTILAQTVKDIEVICVNDCSQDNSLEVIREYAKKDKRVKYVNHETNKRQGGAWNSGLRESKGDYLMFVDQDDWLEPDYFEVLMENNTNADILCAQKYYRGESVAYNVNPTNLIKCNNDLRLNILLNGCFFITNFYKRDFFNRLSFSFLENNMYHDFMTTTLYFRTDNVNVFNRIGYHYRIDNQSITRSLNNAGFWGRLEVAKLEYRTYQTLQVFPQYKDAIDYHFYFLFYRNSLITAFHGYTKYPNDKVRQIIKDTNRYIPSIKSNPYYSKRFENRPFMQKLPVQLVDIFPLWVVSYFHEIFFIYLKTRSIIRNVLKGL